MLVWDFLPISLLAPHDPDATLRSLDRVRLVRRGMVAYVRSGFATIRWDDGTSTVEWVCELERDAA